MLFEFKKKKIISHGEMSFLRAAIKEKERNEIQEQITQPTTVSQEECLPSASKFIHRYFVKYYIIFVL